MGNIQIYSLTDPITQQIRYIGKTSQSLKKRYWDHLCTRENTHRGNWIGSLKKKNLNKT